MPIRINTSGSALLIALVVTVILTIMSTVFLEKLLSFSRSSNGIENSNVAYYYALGGVEESLIGTSVNKYTPWKTTNFTRGSVSGTGQSLVALTGGTMVPLSGYGNSPYTIGGDWNIMSIGTPVQIVVPNNIDWNSVQFYFRIPLVDSTQTSTGINSQLSNSGIVMWTLVSTGGSLFASGETNVFRGYQMEGQSSSIGGFSGITNTGVLIKLVDYYTTYDDTYCQNFGCTLKLSMLRPVSTMLNPSRNIPYLEYKINFGTVSIPQQYMRINATGYANGFARTRTIYIPQLRTNSAFDFAVLQ